MNIQDFKDRKWVILGAQCQLLLVDPFAEVIARDYYKEFGIPLEILGLTKGTFIEWLYDEAQLIALSEKLIPELLPHPWQYYDDWQDKAETYEKFHNKFMVRDLSEYSLDELKDHARAYIQIFQDQFTPSNIIEPLSYYFQHHARNMILASGVPEEEVDDLITLYGQPKYPNYIKKALQEYQLAQNNPEAVQAVLRKYSYLPNDYLGSQDLTIAHLEELSKQESHTIRAETNSELSAETKRILEMFQMIATLQDVRKAYSLMMVDGTQKLATEFSKRFKIPLQLFWYALWEEIYSNTVDQKKLAERAQCYAIFWGTQSTEIIEGAPAEVFTEEIHHLIYDTESEAKEIKGICASRGTVQGKAVIVMHPDEFSKVQEGDVLFTMMTRPEFLPVMQRAAAFVTDEGGLTSHAAIVAREMKKPCIIATKQGTKMVKDGDMVEVDADKGVVRIIHR